MIEAHLLRTDGLREHQIYYATPIVPQGAVGGEGVPVKIQEHRAFAPIAFDDAVAQLDDVLSQGLPLTGFAGTLTEQDGTPALLSLIPRGTKRNGGVAYKHIDGCLHLLEMSYADYRARGFSGEPSLSSLVTIPSLLALKIEQTEQTTNTVRLAIVLTDVDGLQGDIAQQLNQWPSTTVHALCAALGIEPFMPQPAPTGAVARAGKRGRKRALPSREEERKVVQKWLACQEYQTQQAFCEEHGISTSTLKRLCKEWKSLLSSL